MALPIVTDSVIATGTGTGVVTGNLTVAAGDVLYVGIQCSDGSPAGVSSVSSSGGGGALSSIGDSGVVESFLRGHVWRSTSPTPGTVTITANLSASNGEIGVIAVSVAGVDGGTPNGAVVFANGNGTGDAASANVPSDVNALVLDFIGRFQNGNMSLGGGQTQLEQENYASILQIGSSVKDGAANVTTSWGINAQGTVSNWQWVLGALSINGGGGGAPSAPQGTLGQFDPQLRLDAWF